MSVTPQVRVDVFISQLELCRTSCRESLWWWTLGSASSCLISAGNSSGKYQKPHFIICQLSRVSSREPKYLIFDSEGQL